MPRPNFSKAQCEQFEDAANPHQWLLSADRLHQQAVVLRSTWGNERLTQRAHGQDPISWDGANKATLLLCAFTLENAIKAFLVYEHPEWVSNGYLHDEICSHKLFSLSEKSALIPYRKRDRWVLEEFEEGNESWMRYPCARRASDLEVESVLHTKLWEAYLRVTRGYGVKLMKLLEEGWRGTYRHYHRWELRGDWLGAISRKPVDPRLLEL